MFITLETAIALKIDLKDKPYYVITPVNMLESLQFPYMYVGKIDHNFLESIHLHDNQKVFIQTVRFQFFEEYSQAYGMGDY